MSKTNKKRKNKKKNQTNLSKHKRKGKILNPPFLAHDINLAPSSWVNDRLPELLWAILIIGQLKRDDALDFFRYIGKFVEENPECFDVTITGISKLPEDKIKSFIKYFFSYSSEVSEALSPLVLFEHMPAFSDWEEVLPTVDEETNVQKLTSSLSKSYFHQSQEATDCRWVKVLCLVLGEKLKLATEEQVRNILEYPNFGDMRFVRSFIRATEIVRDPSETMDLMWSNEFWNVGFAITSCIPEEVINETMEKRREGLSQEIENTRKHHIDETVKIRKELIDNFFKKTKTTNIDSRFEGAFGLALYSLSLFIETIFYSTSLSITGRLGLRALVESYITFKYLLLKEKSEAKIWDDYRAYGIGQIKLAYLKLEEIEKQSSSIDKDYLEELVNEDKWLEFAPINLGHWDNANLRKMSEEVGLKELYDRLYVYNSNFMHGNWGAIRESIYQKCINPLHRFHRIPIYNLPLMHSVLDDALEIVNDVFGCLHEAYPDFNYKIKHI